MAIYKEQYKPPVTLAPGETPREAVFRANMEALQRNPTQRIRRRLLGPRDLDYDLQPSWEGRRDHRYYLRVNDQGTATLWIRPKRRKGVITAIDENGKKIPREEKQVTFSQFNQAKYPITERLPDGTEQFETVVFWAPEYVRKTMT